MSRAELLAKLREIAARDDRDIEEHHAAADTALLAFINDDEIEAAYDAIEKWYA